MNFNVKKKKKKKKKIVSDYLIIPMIGLFYVNQ